MRKIQIVLPACLTLVLGAAAAAAALAPQPAKPSAPVVRLRPLTEADMMSTREMGCSCSFDSKDGTLVQAIGKELMVRTQSGRKVCRISDAEFQRIAGGSGAFTCGGVGMSLRLTGRTDTSIESDSSSTPASLTLGAGATRRSVSGSWGCAC
jgi:hypothetical protein